MLAGKNQKTVGDSAIPNTFISATNGAVSVSSATSTLIMALNGIRQYASICNDSTTNPLYISLGQTATTTQGIRLGYATSSNPCFEINNTKEFTGAIYGRFVTATGTVTTIEK